MKLPNNTTASIIDSRKASGLPDVAEISKVFHETGLTPYIFVRRGFKYLLYGNYTEAQKYISFAMEFQGLFFKDGTPEDSEYCVEMQLLNATFLFLADKFKNLPPDV